MLVLASSFASYGISRRRAWCFDVIIVDSTDPQGPGKVLFTAEKAAVS
jgi:hypothetical protein